MVSYSETYSGSMDPSYDSVMSGTVWRNYYFGAPTNASKPMQLPEIAKLGMQGIQNIEIGTLDPGHWEAIPKQHFEEMKRLAKLQIGKKSMLSIHAPIAPDPAGFVGRQKWVEESRRGAEQLYEDIVDKAQIIQMDEKIPVPIVIHASSHESPNAVQWRWDKDANNGKGALRKESIGIVNPLTGDVANIEEELRYRPDGTKVLLTVDMTPEYRKAYDEGKPITYKGEKNVFISDRLNEINRSTWDKQQSQLSTYWKELNEADLNIKRLNEDLKEGRITERQAKTEAEGWVNRIRLLSSDFGSALHTTYDQVKKVAPEIMKQVDAKLQTAKSPEQRDTILFGEFMKLGVPKGGEFQGYGVETAPEFFTTVEKHAQKHAAETFANVAFYSYDKYGDKGAALAVENPMPWLAMGRGESLKAGLQEAQRLLVGRLMKEKKLSKGRAEQIAKDKIGATWDIAHINIMRKFGLPPEKNQEEFWKKHLKGEYDAIKNDLKEIQISDNFGFSDVHLAPGTGNVPIREFLRQAEKEGKLGKVKSILESAGMAIHLGIPPSHAEAMQYFGAPLYAGISVPGATWNEIGKNYFFGSAGYSSGYGKFLPEGHFSEYGTGFSQLPTALGGIKEERGRFAGTPMS